MTDVGALLQGVVDDWWGRGPLSVVHELIGEVWRANVERHDPDGHGDDLQSLGIQSARNICNLAVRRCAGLPGVRVLGGSTLTLLYAGRVLHLGKATPEQSRHWSVWSVDWSTSDVRCSAAALNTAAYRPWEGTLLEGIEPRVGAPESLHHLHLAWQGFVDDASVRMWVGFPQAGDRPWFAVVPLPGVAAPERTLTLPVPAAGGRVPTARAAGR
jgi:hypothetical protein